MLCLWFASGMFVLFTWLADQAEDNVRDDTKQIQLAYQEFQDDICEQIRQLKQEQLEATRRVSTQMDWSTICTSAGARGASEAS